MAVFVYPPVPVSISGSATETTLQSVLSELQSIDGKVTAADTGAVTVASSALPTGASTEVTLQSALTELQSIDGKITAVDTGAVTVASSALPTGAATEAKQDSAITELQSIDAEVTASAADLADLNARLGGSFVVSAFDYVALTYVAAGNGAGEIQTVTYKTGGSGGTTVATLTLAYDGSNRLSSVTRS